MSDKCNDVEYIYGLDENEYEKAKDEYANEIRMTVNNVKGLEKARLIGLLTTRFFEQETEENQKWLKEHRYFE